MSMPGVASVARHSGPLTNPAFQLLSELQSAHSDLLVCIALMDRITALPEPDPEQLTRARLKISQASFARRFVWRRIQEHLLIRVRGADCARLRELTERDLKQFQRSTAHVARWTGAAAIRDWPAYRADSRDIRAHMIADINAEKVLLYPMLYRYR